jgi:hypothetical protein
MSSFHEKNHTQQERKNLRENIAFETKKSRRKKTKNR